MTQEMALVIWKMENGFVKIDLYQHKEKQLSKESLLLFFFDKQVKISLLFNSTLLQLSKDIFT